MLLEQAVFLTLIPQIAATTGAAPLIFAPILSLLCVAAIAIILFRISNSATDYNDNRRGYYPSTSTFFMFNSASNTGYRNGHSSAYTSSAGPVHGHHGGGESYYSSPVHGHSGGESYHSGRVHGHH